ncbi:hypothetical protein J2Z83_003536 [Virgibacillus natechei]|uniref:Uncharacterized protein n=1 Tax=Virgibacillus natechei TaxID=1216297 RepID=A0ABS4IKD6_9BACI|nr:hypothetical protein [Virgibacillus natechei]
MHFIVFVGLQAIFWVYGTDSLDEMLVYVTDLSWIEAGTAAESPYANETIYGISMVWGIVFIVDFIRNRRENSLFKRAKGIAQWKGGDESPSDEGWLLPSKLSEKHIEQTF